MRVWKVIFLMLIAVSPIFGTPIVRDIRYSHNGNFLGKLLIPENKSGPAPVIIYVYDEFVDRVGESFAAKRRYDINRHMMEYGKWNAIVIIPMERYRKLNAIQGAIEYARSLPGADPNRIHLVGVSEGGILCLRAAERGKVRTVTVITSSEIADKGAFSYIQLGRSGKKIRCPVMIMRADGDKRWQRLDSQRLEAYLKQAPNVQIRPYKFDRSWFWNEKMPFMWDIRQFIYENGGINLDESPHPF